MENVNIMELPIGTKLINTSELAGRLCTRTLCTRYIPAYYVIKEIKQSIKDKITYYRAEDDKGRDCTIDTDDITEGFLRLAE